MNVNNNEAYMTILLKNQKQYYGAKIDIETGLKDSGFSATFTFIKHITKNSTENEITYDLTHYKTKQTQENIHYAHHKLRPYEALSISVES